MFNANDITFTFQSGYIQIQPPYRISYLCRYLYIPIWLYSNEKKVIRRHGAHNFTFQSGYIQMLRAVIIARYNGSLHSNLVIFKFIAISRSFPKFLCLYIPIWLYSNSQPYSRQMGIYRLYIPIWLYSNPDKVLYQHLVRKLYIPIWLYSNDIEYLAEEEAKFLYIPIWLYSNTSNTIRPSRFIAFTFQSGYIQIKIEPIHLTTWLSFTFQSGYIQICYLPAFVNGYRLYIPIWLYSNYAGSHCLRYDCTLHSNLVIFKCYISKF